jgi:diguanylate cyclase (GGDEF)-like protein
MKEARLHIRKEVWLIRILVISSFISALFFPLYGHWHLFPTFNDLIISMKEKEAVQIGHHITNMIDQSNTTSRQNYTITDLFKEEILPKEIEEIVSHSRHDFGIFKVKVFNAEGLTIYSTTEKDIGVRNTKPYFHNQVAHGRTMTYLVRKDFPSLEGQTYRLDVVETYVPLMEKDTFLGAFEIYYDVSEEKLILKRFIQQASFLAGSISIILLIIVCIVAFYTRRNMTVIKRADKTISLQAAELQKRNDELSILHDLSQVTSQSSEIDALLHSVLETVSERLFFLKVEKRGIIFLCKGNEMEVRAHTGLSQEFIAGHKGLKIGECLCGKSLKEGQILFTDNCKKDSHWMEALPTIPEHGHIIIPLKVADRSLGVLCLYTKPKTKISDHYHRLLEDIGNQVGVAIEKASLFREVKELSLHDALTGLPNRRLMESFLQQTQSLSTRYGRNFSIIMADIDHFKNYNDSHGHTAGDELLQHVASLLQQTTRESDLVARYGGEEFLIILPESEKEQARLVAEQIRITVEQKTEVTISCGYTTYKPGMQLETMTQEADQALYRAKDEGRNRVVGW